MSLPNTELIPPLLHLQDEDPKVEIALVEQLVHAVRVLIVPVYVLEGHEAHTAPLV